MTELAYSMNTTPVAGIPVEYQVMTVLSGIRALKSDGAAYGLESGLTDAGFTSLEMVKVMLAIEAAFDIMIPAADITPANFATPLAISALVSRVLAGV